jgi:ribokinase
MKKPIITVVGSINMDLVTVTNRMPLQGETVMGQSFSTFPGGKGANQAVSATRLGAEVQMLGKVGADLFGTKLKELLRQEGVTEENVEVTTNKETGTASIIISDQDNQIIVVPGANSEVTPEWVITHEEKIRNSDLLLLQLEIQLDSVIKATEIANKYQIPVILNPAPYQRLPKKLLDGITYLTPNEHEYSQLLEEATEEEKAQIKAKSIVTKGEEGVQFQLDNQNTLVNVIKVEVVDTTGAGDTFNGALAVALSEKNNLKDAILFASMAASLSVTKMGAQTGMPFRHELDHFYKLKATELELKTIS